MPGRPYTRVLNSSGFSLVELLSVVATIAVLAALTVPSLLRAKVTANEGAILGSLRAIHSAEAAYAASASPGNYATELSVLAQPCPGGTHGFISADLAGDPSMKSGYVVTLGPGSSGAGTPDCNGTPTAVGYYLTAVPVSFGMTGHRGFASSSRGVIFFDATGAAPTEASMAPGGGGSVIQ